MILALISFNNIFIYQMTLRLFIVLFCFQFGFSQPQDTINSQEETSKKATALKSLIDGNPQTLELISHNDSFSKRSLEDNKLAAELDEKWLNELYSSSLYDTIYKSVSELKYDNVYYPELPTDTLKKLGFLYRVVT